MRDRGRAKHADWRERMGFSSTLGQWFLPRLGLENKGIYYLEMSGTWYKMVTMLQSGLHLSPTLTHSFAVDDYQEAFATMLSGQSGKVILDWTV
jgi:threonine dehydrogenase-like Zn-dependent dehydrogenase